MKVSEAKLARLAAGYRQMDLARKVQISPGLVSLYENGDSQPSPRLARKINDLLGKKVYPEGIGEKR